MPIGTPINPDILDWTGDNPGIMLKEHDDGPWSALALFFRISWSPHGRGTVLVLYEQPDAGIETPAANNVVISDNEPLARYLMREFVGKFGVFGEVAAFNAMRYLPLTHSATTGDPGGRRVTEAVASGALCVDLVWEGLGRPTALELPPELSGTGAHTMFSLLVESRQAAILVNGHRLPGQPVPREQAGIQTTTAFLYYAESWLRAS
ncbi:MAG: hypothetical protein RIS90_1896 [Pseudomonadota bacterium]|jgi:hypothetical protein